jgi:hypothetical protein
VAVFLSHRSRHPRLAVSIQILAWKDPRVVPRTCTKKETPAVFVKKPFSSVCPEPVLASNISWIQLMESMWQNSVRAFKNNVVFSVARTACPQRRDGYPVEAFLFAEFL